MNLQKKVQTTKRFPLTLSTCRRGPSEAPFMDGVALLNKFSHHISHQPSIVSSIQYTHMKIFMMGKRQRITYEIGSANSRGRCNTLARTGGFAAYINDPIFFDISKLCLRKIPRNEERVSNFIYLKNRSDYAILQSENIRKG